MVSAVVVEWEHQLKTAAPRPGLGPGPGPGIGRIGATHRCFVFNHRRSRSGPRPRPVVVAVNHAVVGSVGVFGGVCILVVGVRTAVAAAAVVCVCVGVGVVAVAVAALALLVVGGDSGGGSSGGGRGGGVGGGGGGCRCRRCFGVAARCGLGVAWHRGRNIIPHFVFAGPGYDACLPCRLICFFLFLHCFVLCCTAVFFFSFFFRSLHFGER